MLLDVLASLRNLIVKPPVIRKFALKAVEVAEVRVPVVVARLPLLALALLTAAVEMLAMEG
jgi:hypothetical protein